MCVAVGVKSCKGRIMAHINQAVEGETPLQEKLNVIAENIGKFGILCAIGTVGILFLRFTIDIIGTKGSFDFSQNIGFYLQVWFKYIIMGITIVVVAVPEGLPLAVMVSLAYSVRKMYQD